MIVTISGNNLFLTKRRLDELTGDFIKRHGELAIERLDAEESQADAIIGAVQSPAFLAQRKMTVIKNLGADKQAAPTLEQIIYSLDDSTDIIFYEPLTDKRTAFFKLLKSKTQFEEYTEMDASSLAAWLTEEAQRRGGKISLGDGAYLIERAGANQLKLANELEKLLAYEPQITRDAIDLLVEKTPQSKIFDLLDAAFAGNKKKALEYYDEQRTQKVEPQTILAMIAWQLQLIILAQCAGTRSAGEIAKDMGLNPYPVQKSLGLARRIGEEKLREMAAEALKIDLLSKKSPIDLDEALKSYITGL